MGAYCIAACYLPSAVVWMDADGVTLGFLPNFTIPWGEVDDILLKVDEKTDVGSCCPVIGSVTVTTDRTPVQDQWAQRWREVQSRPKHRDISMLKVYPNFFSSGLNIRSADIKSSIRELFDAGT